MDDSTFETFEEELGATQKDVSHPKHSRQSRRPVYPQRRVREEPLVVQQIPKSLPREAPVSKGVSLRKSLSIEDSAQIEAPWEGVTLNRCLLIAITILVLTSGCQRLHEFLRGHKEETDIEPICSVLNSRHTAVRKYRLPAPEPETSLWDTFFWWVSEDDDEEKGRRRGKSRKVTREKATRGLRHKAIPDRKLLKGREGSFKARRAKARQDERKSRETLKAQQEKVKKLQEKKLDEEERKGKEDKIVKNAAKKRKKNAS
ncbi:uncharacterized protein Hap1MRO34_000214 isoform 2-T2 [Clarias gariepinus]|uniref:capping protein inhibiting regulator of actin dynamics isoform X2 n=1 Tax=Clarias gariepinus TaxID=13013 RepID=UPI00234D392B|nr:capping protein inhibiting regulator of actin dynamics isoform X2 [Clarias gariepinus]